MGSLLSKDMMYPSLKEMTEQYPKWLEENKAKLSKEDLERSVRQMGSFSGTETNGTLLWRYELQLGLMQEAVAEYDKETPEDPDEVG